MRTYHSFPQAEGHDTMSSPTRVQTIHPKKVLVYLIRPWLQEKKQRNGRIADVLIHVRARASACAFLSFASRLFGHLFVEYSHMSQRVHVDHVWLHDHCEVIPRVVSSSVYDGLYSLVKLHLYVFQWLSKILKQTTGTHQPSKVKSGW